MRKLTSKTIKPEQIEKVNENISKNYFIGQGTNIIAEFDTLEKMLEYHKNMPDMDELPLAFLTK